MANIIRLLPSINLGWTLYPAFEDRVVKMQQEHFTETTPSQMQIIIQALRQRWINDPVASGYWLALDGREVVGHAAAWLAVDWNQPYAFFYQVAAPLTDVGIAERWVSELRGWVEEMNAALVARNSPPIGYIEMATFRKPEAFERFLKAVGMKNFRHRAVLRFDL